MSLKDLANTKKKWGYPKSKQCMEAVLANKTFTPRENNRIWAKFVRCFDVLSQGNKDIQELYESLVELTPTELYESPLEQDMVLLKQACQAIKLAKTRLDPNMKILSKLTAKHKNGHLVFFPVFEPLLCYAVECFSAEILKELLELGLNPNVQDRSGRTPTFIASDWRWKEPQRDKLRLLKEHGADMTKTGPQLELTTIDEFARVSEEFLRDIVK